MPGRGTAALVDELPKQKQSDEQGQEVREIRERRSAGSILASQLTNIAAIMLTAAAALSAFTGSLADALPIILMAILNTSVGFIGEYRCEKTLRRIAEISPQRAAAAAAELSGSGSPLDRDIDRAGRILSAVSLTVCAALFVFSMIRGEGIAQSFYISAALAIASVPQGIRSVYTIARGAAISRAYRQGAVVFSPSAFEKLSCAGMLCIGKSGIVTENRLSVASLAVFSSNGFTEYEYSEIDGRLTSGIGSDGFRAWEDSALSRVLICAAVCNNARRVRSEAGAQGRNRGRRSYYDGDPTDSALLRLCSACGIERELLICEKLSEQPFEIKKRYMMVTVREQHGKNVTYAKGAPEEITSLCSLGEGVQSGVDMLCAKYAATGMRLLAFCMNGGAGWVFLGLAAIRDPLKHLCADNIRRLRRLGVGTIMLTGDYPMTAAAVASRAGMLPPEPVILSGSELKAMSDEQLYEGIRSISLVARALPEDRERIIDALHGRGVVCADISSGASRGMADISISAAEHDADILLTESGLGGAASAIEESRALFENIRRTVCCMTASCFTILLSAAVPVIIGMPKAFMTCQLLLAAVLCGSIPSVLLVGRTPRKSGGISNPEKQESSCFEGGILADAAGRGVLGALSVFGCYALLLSAGETESAAGSCALLTLVISQMFLFAEYSGFDLHKNGGLTRLAACIIPLCIFLGMMYLPAVGGIFSLTAPGMKPLLLSVSMAAAVPIVTRLRRLAMSLKG